MFRWVYIFHCVRKTCEEIIEIQKCCYILVRWATIQHLWISLPVVKVMNQTKKLTSHSLRANIQIQVYVIDSNSAVCTRLGNLGFKTYLIIELLASGVFTILWSIVITPFIHQMIYFLQIRNGLLRTHIYTYLTNPHEQGVTQSQF